MMQKRRKIVLENGMSFPGNSCGGTADCTGEAIVYTSETDGKELVSDPSFAGEIIIVPYCTPSAENADESVRAYIKGFVAGDYSKNRDFCQLSSYLDSRNIPGICPDDIPALVEAIWKKGRMRAAIVDEDTSTAVALQMIEDECRNTDWAELTSVQDPLNMSAPGDRHHVVILDCGMKPAIAEELRKRGCSITVVPCRTDAESIEVMHPDGILISSGPGNPVQMEKTVRTINSLKGKCPIFGICLGQELIALSYGAEIIDLGCGHHGEQPVLECSTGNVITVTHNHNFAVDGTSAAGCGLSVTHKNVSDDVVEGLENKEDRIFSVQYHPEGTPGAKDSAPFDKFIEMMNGD